VDDTRVFMMGADATNAFAVARYDKSTGVETILLKSSNTPLEAFGKHSLAASSQHLHFVWKVSNNVVLAALPKGGGAVQDLATLPSSDFDPAFGFIGGLIASDTTVFVAAPSLPRLYAIPASGGSPTLIANHSSTGGNIYSLVYRDGYVYYTTYNSWTGEIRRVKADGTSAAVIASEPGFYLQVDSTHVYWTDPSGLVRSKSLAGGPVTSFPNTMCVLEGVDETFLYTGTAYFSYGRIRKDGSAPAEKAFECSVYGKHFALGSDAMYVSSSQSPHLYRMVK
jgi:hypothetical protein